MAHRMVGISLSIVAAALVGGLVVFATLRSVGQGMGAATAQRTADGRPDLNGVWQAVNTANWDLEAHMARPALMVRPGRVPGTVVPAAPVLAMGAAGAIPAGLGVVEGGDIPYQAWALEKKKHNAAHWAQLDPEVRCYLPGVPRATYIPYPFQIFQSRDSVMFVYEFANANRVIHMNGTGESPAESWMGWSNGRWEGDTLVVDVSGFNDQTWFDRAGNFHSDALHVIERYTPMGPDHLQYEATIEDPKVFTRPWKITMPLYRRRESGVQLLEHKCVEFVEELMYGHLRREQLPIVMDYDRWYMNGRPTLNR